MASPRLRVSLTELDAWSLDDMLDAHDALDALEVAEQAAAEQR